MTSPSSGTGSEGGAEAMARGKRVEKEREKREILD
jgi:hypothetical protein